MYLTKILPTVQTAKEVGKICGSLFSLPGHAKSFGLQFGLTLSYLKASIEPNLVFNITACTPTPVSLTHIH